VSVKPHLAGEPSFSWNPHSGPLPPRKPSPRASPSSETLTPALSQGEREHFLGSLAAGAEFAGLEERPDSTGIIAEVIVGSHGLSKPDRSAIADPTKIC
jgi:hypothetical protein